MASSRCLVLSITRLATRNTRVNVRPLLLSKICQTWNLQFSRKLSSPIEALSPNDPGFVTERLSSGNLDPLKSVTVDNEQSFESLFKKSKFVGILDPVGKKVKGEIIAVVEDNLYVDFGSKFHAVVKRPEKDKDCYVEGANVVVLVKDLEMSMHPLGSHRDISLLEAEAELCGLVE